MRIVFTYLVPFLLPIAIYVGWVLYRTRYVARHGGEAPKFERGPWPLLIFIGAVFTLAVMGVVAMERGEIAGSRYEPARIGGGRIVPGHLDSSER